MLTGLYVAGGSPLYRAHPGLKIVLLLVICTGLFVSDGWLSVFIALSLVMAGFAIGGLSPRHAFDALQPAFYMLALILVVQIWIVDIAFAGYVVARFVTLILAASLVTLTTTTSQFVDGILFCLGLAPRWVPKQRIALAIALALRFIPLIRSVYEEVRQAQQARGMDGNVIALLTPLVIRTLKSADEIAAAIQARSFD